MPRRTTSTAASPFWRGRELISIRNADVRAVVKVSGGWGRGRCALTCVMCTRRVRPLGLVSRGGTRWEGTRWGDTRPSTPAERGPFLTQCLSLCPQSQPSSDRHHAGRPSRHCSAAGAAVTDAAGAGPGLRGLPGSRRQRPGPEGTRLLSRKPHPLRRPALQLRQHHQPGPVRVPQLGAVPVCAALLRVHGSQRCVSPGRAGTADPAAHRRALSTAGQAAGSPASARPGSISIFTRSHPGPSLRRPGAMVSRWESAVL